MSGPRIGLALGGGGARGLAHIPVLEVLDEFGITPSIVAGTSIGAFIGAGYAGGMSGKDIRSYVQDLFSDRGAVLARIWDQRPRSFGDLVSGFSGVSLQLSAERIVDLFLPDQLPNTIEDLPTPFTAVASDFYNGTAATLAAGALRPSIAASIAIPILFRPVVVNERVMIDGGLTNPLPIDIAGKDADIVIAVDVVGGPQGETSRVPKAVDLAFGTSQVMMRTITRERLKTHAPDILLTPNIDAFRVLEFFRVRAILKASEPIKDELRRALDAKLSAFGK